MAHICKKVPLCLVCGLRLLNRDLKLDCLFLKLLCLPCKLFRLRLKLLALFLIDT